jgi:hypothetical protein
VVAKALEAKAGGFGLLYKYLEKRPNNQLIHYKPNK